MSDSHTHFDALTIVSPACLGGEDKNQDRAHWFPERQVAGVCDGVTNSPRSAEAAKLVTSLLPMLFGGDFAERLAGTCDLLVARRQKARNRTVVLPPETSPAMRDLLIEVARERMAVAFQTTLIALSVTATDRDIIAQIVRCGDSALFAFSETGDLLASSPTVERSPEEVSGSACANGIQFGPGHELLVKVLGNASDEAFRVDLHKSHLKSPSRWFVCAPLDVSGQCTTPAHRGQEMPTHVLSRADLLLVPQYLVGHSAACQTYHHIPYSSSVRVAAHAPPTAALCFNGKSNVTDVLPDHFFSDRWVHRQEHFPLDTNFVLASDGFYGAFENAQELWTWLLEARTDLHAAKHRAKRMRHLHRRLNERSGDDDISFVWVFPRRKSKETGEQGTQAKSSRRHRCQRKRQRAG